MVAISSIKPFAKSAEVAENQRCAKATWEKVFSAIWYFNDCCASDLASPKTRMKLTDDFPRISDMVAFAAQQPEWACLINADIIVSENLFHVEQELKRLKAQSAMSRRWQMPDNRVVDMGLDWFAATPELWAKILPEVPTQFRMGHILWDTWMLDAFTRIGSPFHSYDVTGCRVIFHPQHEDRDRPYEVTAPEALNRSKIIWPRPLIIHQ